MRIKEKFNEIEKIRHQEMTSFARNGVCWCGSGKKYKKCHYGRDSKEPEHKSYFENERKKIFEIKKCMAHDSGFGPCDADIKNAHTVSRSSGLNAITENGKVLSLNPDYYGAKTTNQFIKPELVGYKKQASTFYGFCEKHDTSLFSCFENKPYFIGNQDQCAALAYRSISRELYGKHAQREYWPILLDRADYGKSFEKQKDIQFNLQCRQLINDYDIIDFEYNHNKLANLLVTNHFVKFHTTIIEFDGMLPYMFASAFSPINDLYGKQIQSQFKENLELIFVSAINNTNTEITYICISWFDTLNGSIAPGKILSNQIKQLPLNNVMSTFLQYVMQRSNNVFFKPSWFDKLPDKQKKHLNKLIMYGVDILNRTGIDKNMSFSSIPKIVNIK